MQAGIERYFAPWIHKRIRGVFAYRPQYSLADKGGRISYHKWLACGIIIMCFEKREIIAFLRMEISNVRN
jgi:hypothetical protein